MRVMSGSSVLARRPGVPETLIVRRAPVEESLLCTT
jgi:hypothetical protein